MRALDGQARALAGGVGSPTARRWLVINPWARALLKRIPSHWARPLAAQLRALDAGEFATPSNNAAIEARLNSFTQLHGDALNWCIDAGQVRDMAQACAALFEDAYRAAAQLQGVGAEYARLDGGHFKTSSAALELQCVGIMARLFDALGLELPQAASHAGALARSTCLIWWRRAIKRKAAQAIELGNIKLGLVNKNRGAYCSSQAVEARLKQLAANAAYLEKSLIKNEAGQVFRLATLAAGSVANPDIRRGELMARVRGCEEWAKEQNHIGLFATLTAPSRFHAQTIIGKQSRPNPHYDQNTSPRLAQKWLCKTWARARAELARRGIRLYGLRVAEPHHDGCPHWHALLFAANEEQAKAAQAIIKKHWLKDAGEEQGAARYRCQFKRLSSNGAAAYVAKYISKSVGGSLDIGAHLDSDGGQTYEVKRGRYTGAQRVDAWASLWRVRQFQFIGLPAVGIWRELRKVRADQLQDMLAETGEKYAFKAWFACHKNIGADVQASWRHFMKQAGGAGIARKDCTLRLAIGNQPQDGHANRYGEKVKRRKVWGVVLLSGYWLVSRRMAWQSVAGEAGAKPTTAEENARLAAPWSGFNNCTARIKGKLRAALFPQDEAARQARLEQEKIEKRLAFIDHYAQLSANFQTA